MEIPGEKYDRSAITTGENTTEEFTATFSMKDWAGEHKTRITITGTVAAVAVAAVAMTAYYIKHHKN